MDYAANLDALGHSDWRLPTRAELRVLFENRAKIGSFDETDTYPSWYWSAAENPDNPGRAWMERFSDGYRVWHWKDLDVSVRPVRSGP